jgi:hypothetical protein
MSDAWQAKRAGFIARHTAQIDQRAEPLWGAHGQPTRRHLALAVWAYSPEPRALEGWLRKNRHGRRRNNHAALGDSVSDVKHQIKTVGDRFFGQGAVTLKGKKGAYIMRITPKLKAHKALFRPQTAYDSTLEGLRQQLDRAIGIVKGATE